MSYKVLGSVSPAAATLSTMYVVTNGPIAAVISSLTICNTSSTPASFRVAVSPVGVTLALRHYIYYDAELQGNATFVFTGGITMGTDDMFRVQSSTGTLSFNLFGKEIT